MNCKKLIASLLAVTLSLGLVGCTSIFTGKTSGAELTLWYEAATVKLVQDDKGEAAKTANDKQTLKVNMARNESEGVQMMIYAKKDIAYYEVSVSDLISDMGIITADTVDIYQVKYIPLDGNRVPSNPNFVSGELPDPLLPFETAIEYNENFIEKGKNQSIYLDITTDASTPAGVYNASVTVTTEEGNYQIPLEVTVYDVTYPDTAKLKTTFSYFDRDHFATAELDASDAQTTALFETMLDYNMSSFMPYEGEGVEKYVELVRKYYNHPGFSTYRLFYQIASAPYDGELATYNAALLKEYVKAIAKASVEDHINYLDKAICYFYTVADEPREEAHFITAQKALSIYNNMLRDADEEMRNLFAGTKDYEYYMSTVSDAVLSIPNILPGYFDMDQVRQYDMETYTLTPLTNEMETESDRRYYTEGREDIELWTYTCNQPLYPYPSGHIDDYSVGFRLTSWMCFDYDWDGFLYWCTVNYLNLAGGEVKEDVWETMDTGQGRPGEGKFFYPGEKYGLDTPCPSLRAMAYRDGVDDYSLLQAVEDIYNEYGFSADVALDDIFEQVYTGVIPITDSYVFEHTRESVFKLIEELKSDTAVLYVDSKVDFATAYLALKTVNENASILVDGKAINADEKGIYNFEIDLTKQNSFAFTVKCGDKEKDYSRKFISGKLGIAQGFEDSANIEDLIFSSTAGHEISVNEKKEYVKDGEKSVHILLNKDKENTLPYFAFLKESELIGGSFAGINSISFYAYNAGKEETEMNITYYTSGEVTITNVTLVPGEWTLIEIPMPKDIDNLDEISEIDCNFENGTLVDLYIDSFSTNVKED